ncbi:MAG TPA: glycine--tRNA ligase subunit beta, partial [Sulfurovum sp.]|nr:glycine--tRNA ligase subunit beta [Sulfurovum sp.]
NKIAKKVAALGEIASSDVFSEQFSTFKRVANISKDIDLDAPLGIDVSLFTEDAEVTLYNAYEKVINGSYNNYKQHLEALFGLKRELDGYFDGVMVNAEDETLRVNRQHMIGSIYRTFMEVADIKEITV